MDFTPGSLFASLLISSLGTGFFLYGKKQERLPQLLTGCALMGFPYLVASVPWMIGIALALVGALYGAVRAGL